MISGIKPYSPMFQSKKTENKLPLASDRMMEERMNGFKQGVVAGALLAASLGIGINDIHNTNTSKVLEEFQKEYKMDDTKALHIEDFNDDNVPEIILDKESGDKMVFDVKNNDINFVTEFDTIPWLY